MSVQKIFLHIGPPKCGTTSIQVYLDLYKGHLSKQGILYPVNNKTAHFKAHHPLACCYYLNPDVGSLDWIPKYEKETVLNDIEREIETHKPHTLVLSSEAFWRIDSHNKLQEDLSKYSENIYLFTFIRRQDLWLESFYREMRRTQDDKNERFERFYSDMKSVMNFEKMLNPWAEAFGHENLIVNVLEREQLPKGLVPHMLEIIGAQHDPSMEEPEDLNTSLNRDVLNYIEKFPATRKFKKLFIKPCYFLTEYSAENPDIADKRFYSNPKHRVEIIKYYEASNTTVARKYLRKNGEKLFLTPEPTTEDAWIPHNRIKLSKALYLTWGILKWYIKTLTDKDDREIFMQNHRDRKRPQKK
jgi:hypothetical protein